MKIAMRKFARTISGVTPVAVMTEPMPCPGECIYCPTYPATPQSYTPKSPAVLRGTRNEFDAARQVQDRLKALSQMGHPTDKVELIVMGGTFLSTPPDYQYRFIKGCYDALNGEESATLAEARRANQTARRRCVGLCIETRPDWCRQAEIDRMLEFGATRVELGVQTLDDDIFRLVKRGHTVDDVTLATSLLKRHGFKVHYHWMPGLPGATPEKDLDMFRQLFADQRFRPDGLKLYPTMVVAGTELETWYREGRYRPYPDDTMIELLAEIKALVPGYVRISRVLRDIPTQYIVAGCRDSLRGVVRERMARDGTACQCIRCREYGHRSYDGWKPGEPKLVRTDYDASGGREVFLSYEDDQQTLFGLLRLRVEPALDDGSGDRRCTVRELHVYGPEVPLKHQAAGAEAVSSETAPVAAATDVVQHRGLGRSLFREAERIAGDEFGARQLAVLSGVGAREYYRAGFGYRDRGHYVVRDL